MSAVAMRRALASDREFLEDMLLEAANWLPGRTMTREQLMADPDLRHYVEGWPRDRDLGVVAAGLDGVLLGAIWSRYLVAADAGFGYVADNVPEVSMGVVREARGRGIGRALLRAHASSAREAGVPTLSLSVERANHAWQLYVDEGWRVVASERDSDTMIRDLTGVPSSGTVSGQPRGDT